MMLYEDNYLMHHGIKGQKWGIRRYQNPDGTLTDEGQQRLESLRAYTGRGAANVTEPGVDREQRLMRKIGKAEKKGRNRKVARLEKKLIAQQKANDDAKKYVLLNADKINRGERQHVNQNEEQLGPNWGTDSRRMLRLYHKARARGSSPVSAYLETALPGGMLVRAIKNKRKYGKALVYGAMETNDSIET